jgi:hypothetical protein
MVSIHAEQDKRSLTLPRAGWVNPHRVEQPLVGVQINVTVTITSPLNWLLAFPVA